MDINWITLIFSAVVAISTLFYVYLTGKLVKETRIMRKFQVEPHIIAYLDVAETDSDIVFIKIKNIGLGVALNVKFSINKDINYPKSRSLDNLWYFMEGINYFPPQHEDSLFLFSFHNDKDAKIKDYVSFEVKYTSILGESKNHLYTLKFNEISNTGTFTPPVSFLGNIIYQLERIEKSIEKNKHEA